MQQEEEARQALAQHSRWGMCCFDFCCHAVRHTIPRCSQHPLNVPTGVGLSACRSGVKRQFEPSDPNAPADPQLLKEKLLRMESDFRSSRQQEQGLGQTSAAAAAAALGHERGLGDWAHYQPPSAVLQAVKQQQQQQQHAHHALCFVDGHPQQVFGKHFVVGHVVDRLVLE